MSHIRTHTVAHTHIHVHLRVWRRCAHTHIHITLQVQAHTSTHRRHTDTHTRVPNKRTRFHAWFTACLWISNVRILHSSLAGLRLVLVLPYYSYVPPPKTIHWRMKTSTESSPERNHESVITLHSHNKIITYCNWFFYSSGEAKYSGVDQKCSAAVHRFVSPKKLLRMNFFFFKQKPKAIVTIVTWI